MIPRSDVTTPNDEDHLPDSTLQVAHDLLVRWGVNYKFRVQLSFASHPVQQAVYHVGYVVKFCTIIVIILF